MLRTQCRLFMAGSSLFATGTVPGSAVHYGAGASNLLCFAGSCFFTSAALIQLLLSTPSMDQSRDLPAIRAERFSAAIQFFGTLNFNLSTSAPLWAESVSARRHFMWWPDAAGSAAFLVSAALGVVAIALTAGPVPLRSRLWLAACTTMIGSIAFAASAVGAFITKTGITQDAQIAQLGTFIGALCFLIAAILRLPQRLSPDRASSRA